MRPAPTPGSEVVGLPITVTFSELNENPAAYQNQLLRVSGAFTRVALEPCRHRRGPRIQWGLIDEELRLDSAGLNPVVRLVPEGASMTIDGWWRLYQGPLGCGKKPLAGFAWYLEAAQIIAPNPLPQFGEYAPPPTGEAAPTPSGEPDTPSTLEPLPTAVTLEPDGSYPGAPPTATPAIGQPIQPTATAGSAPTGAPPTAVASPTITPTPSRTVTPAATATSPAPPPPLATATPGAGYVPPPTNPTPLPTPTPGY